MTDKIEAADEEARKSALALQDEALTADPDTIRLLFTQARTHYGWLDRGVGDDKLREIYDIAKMGPTSMNQQPMRVLFIRSKEAKDRLEPCLMPGNRPKMRSAPVTAIVAFDLNFWEELPTLFPPNPNARDIFKDNAAATRDHSFRNGTLQGAYLMLAARAAGLDVGGMSGFDNAKVDGEFFNGTSLKSNFMINIGYADTSKVHRRLPRLDFEKACQSL